MDRMDGKLHDVLDCMSFPMPFVYVKLGIESVRIRTEGSSQNVKSARTAQH